MWNEAAVRVAAICIMHIVLIRISTTSQIAWCAVSLWLFCAELMMKNDNDNDDDGSSSSTNGVILDDHAHAFEIVRIYYSLKLQACARSRLNE